jgi:hypothetical protein
VESDEARKSATVAIPGPLACILQAMPMSRIIIILLLIFKSGEVFSTPQIPDKLVYGIDTLYLRETPFSKEHDFLKKIEEKLPDFQSSCCYDKFWAEWKLVDDKIYLNDIKSCENGESIIHEFIDFYDSILTEYGYQTSWVNGIFWADYGARIDFEYSSFYENEIKLTMLDGLIKEKEKWSHEKCFEENWEDFLRAQIYQNIDWTLFDFYLPFRLGFEFEFKTDRNQKILVRKFKTSYTFQEKIQEDIMRILNDINCWDIYYYYGKPAELEYFFHIEFDNTLKNKYAR